MVIDIHTHVNNRWDHKQRGMKTFTIEWLMEIMDGLGIDRFVILPIGASPETRYFYSGNECILEMYRKYPDRVIPFCNIDPRAGSNSETTDFSWILNYYKEQGCRGLGELSANMYIDDPKYMNLYRYCGKVGFPVIVHLYGRFNGSYGPVDDLHLPRLERVLRECPETVFLGHAYAFWSEISGAVTEDTRIAYVKGKIHSPGRVCELLEKYPNLYGDISAGSGYHAITSDPEFGPRFLEEFQDKLLFGTDTCHYEGTQGEILRYLKETVAKGLISQNAYTKITEKNAKKLLQL
ncbi:MAG TPA: amidohydrolase family protein [bacterium]|nr:amidohydrolase family protein [bacterium]